MNSSPSATQDILDHLGEGLAERHGIATNSLHGAAVQGGRVRKLDTFCVWGKRLGPTPVMRKRGHKILTLLCLNDGCWQAKRKDMGGLCAKDKLTSQGLY